MRRTWLHTTPACRRLRASPDARAEIFSPYEHGKKLAQACTRCHGENGNSTTPGTPSLSGQQPGYFVAAIQEYLTGARETRPHAFADTGLERGRFAKAWRSISRPRPRRNVRHRLSAMPRRASRSPVCAADATASMASAPIRRRRVWRARIPSISWTPSKPTAPVASMRRCNVPSPNVKSDKDAENIAAFYAVQKLTAAVHGQTLVHDLADKCNRCHSPSVDNPTLVIPNVRRTGRGRISPWR